MIRFIYWLLALIELLLILLTIILFIVTDSRTINYIAENTLERYDIHYESIKGNLFEGLSIKKLSYQNQELFSSALIHWNPLSLLDEKLTITKVDIEGIEVENLITTVNALKSKNSKSHNALPFDIIVKNTHLDINPYLYEGVKFSSFILETGEISVKKELTLNAERLYLKFDSDIVNAKVDAKIVESQLLVDDLVLNDISIQAITKLTKRLKKRFKKRDEKRKTPKSSTVLKDIKIEHIKATLKSVRYGDFKIKGATANIYNGTIAPSHNFKYQVEKIDFKGQTNFGKLDYKGYIKDSNIFAKGLITLDKELFRKYSLPLNYKALKKLPSKLHLNHQGVWIEIDHKVKELLKIQSDFNLDVRQAKHEVHYDYEDGILTVESELKGEMNYAENYMVKNRLHLDKKGLTYEGELSIEKTRALPNMLTEYLLSEVNATYKGTKKSFKMNFNAPLLIGELTLPHYKSAEISLKSRGKNVALNRLIPNLPMELRDEKISLESNSFFDFKNLKESNINLLAHSQLLDVEAKMVLSKPKEITFSSTIKGESRLSTLTPNVKFDNLKYLNGRVKIENNHYFIDINNEYLKLFLNFNALNSSLESSSLTLDGQQFSIERDGGGDLLFQTHIDNIQAFFERIKTYYVLEVPNVQGEVDLRLEQRDDGSFWIHLQSSKLQYLSENSVDLSIFNIYDIDTTFTIDGNSNIKISNYQFRLDDNGYLNTFYSNRVSSLSLEDKRLMVNNLWLNDKINIIGEYNIESLKGEFSLKSDGYRLDTKDFSLLLGLDLKMKLNKEKVNIEGDIDILEGTITYEMAGSNIVEDSDIIIVENMIREKESAFNNLKLYLKIKNKKPLKYIAEDVNIAFLNELSLLKNYNQKMLLTGVSTISNGYYQLDDKKFLLDESHLYFMGNLKSPLLDIKANYEKDQYMVHIFISGTTDAPIVNFNAEPYLTQQEILSLILFDGTGSSSGKGAEAYTLLGGTFAKGLIKSLGINVDHLLLGQDSNEQLSLEVGGKISKKVSVIYLHKDGLDGAKVRIEHSRSFETDIIIQPPNTSSIEFLYKQDR